MSASQIAVPGACAGLTIFPGLLLGRVRAQMPRVKVFLKAPAIGMPIFLLWDVLTSAWEPAGTALGPHRYARVVADGRVMLACVGLGRMGPVLSFVTDALASAADGGNPR